VISTVIFTVIFGHFAKLPTDGIASSLFFFCGNTIWGLFSNIVTRAGGSIIADERMITKVYFPRAIIPLSSVFSSGFDFLVTFVLLIIIALCYGYPPGFYSAALIPSVLIAVLAGAGIGTALAGWTVRYRDFRVIVPFLVQIGLYASFIVYPISLIPRTESLWFHFINPMIGSIELFRYGITGTTPVDPLGCAISLAMACVFLVGGALVFRQVESSFADNI
jgi:lipopolysaccharide transport system permease protein